MFYSDYIEIILKIPVIIFRHEKANDSLLAILGIDFFFQLKNAQRWSFNT